MIERLFSFLPEKILEVLSFWIYDSLKIIVLMAVLLFIVNYLRTYVDPQKIKKVIVKNKFSGYIYSALLGTLSPFCSCSTIPLFLGFLRAGMPLGATMTFLFASPMINLAALPLLVSMLGMKFTLIYVVAGLAVSISAGYTMERLGFEKSVERGETAWKKQDEEKVKKAYGETKMLLSQLTPYVIVGTAIGALIHGYVPTSLVQSYSVGLLAVPVALLLGVPLYVNIFAVLPVVQPLLDKGMPIYVAVVFIMSATGLSLPEFVILSKVMKKKILFSFISLITLGILLVGFILALV